MGWTPDRWWLGLPVLALVWAGTTWWATPRLEAELKAAIQDSPDSAALRRAGARVELHGRDAEIVVDFALPARTQQAVENAVRVVPGIRRVAFRTATPVALRPFRLTIRRERGGIALSGGVPEGGLHARLLEAAAGLVGPDRIDDKLVPGLDSPPAFAEAAETALTLAGHLSQGQVSLVDRQVGIQGEATDFAGYNAIASGLLTLPPGYGVSLREVLPPVADPFRWSLARDGGGIRLAGNVPTEAARDALREAVAAALPGVPLRDEMQTARGLPADLDFSAIARAALGSVTDLVHADAVFEAGRLSLSGDGAARDVLDTVPDRLRQALPPGVTAGSVRLTPIPASPYTFEAVRAANRLALDGFSPDPKLRDDIQAMARDRFPGEAVAAEIHLADGAPDGFPVAVAAGLESLASLADGRVQISDRRITLRGRSLYPETAERMRQRFASVLPAGWDAAIEVRAEPIEKPLEAGLCTDLLNDLARRDPVRFEPKAVEPSPKAAGSLDGLAGVLRRCGGARLRVAVRPESAEDRSAAQALADQRAKALATVLSSRVPGASLNAAIESAPAKPDSERVAFSVEP